jgi:hypothetical protein
MRDARAALLVAVGLCLLYLSNGRSQNAGDTIPATYLAVCLVRGDGPVLDRFDHLIRDPDGRLPGFAEDARGHAVSRYPVGPALVAAPLVLPQVLWLDATEPGWESDPNRARLACDRMAKAAAAGIAALAAAVNLLVLRRLGLSLRVAAVAAVSVALGSGDFSTASQALWQHGPAELSIGLALLMLLGPSSSGRLALAGLAAAMAVVCRPIDLVPAVALAAWVLVHHDRRRRWAFVLPAAAAAMILLAYNVYFFNAPAGGYKAIERMHPWAHGTRGTWTAPFLEGAAGTLFSPSHGLFVYAPWVLPALIALPWSMRDRLSRRSPAFWLIGSLAPTFVLLSKYSCWWGGHCFGARFWIDANPAFAVALGLALAWAWDGAPARRRWPWRVALAASIACAAAAQAVGFLAYPSTWHGTPTNADRDHARLWDWSDSELTRCLREGPRPPSW